MTARTAIIGLGIMGRRMLEHMLRHPGYQPVALWDPDPLACQEARALAPDVRIATSADDAMADAELVYLACPPVPRKAYALAAKRDGKAVFLEKTARRGRGRKRGARGSVQGERRSGCSQFHPGRRCGADRCLGGCPERRPWRVAGRRHRRHLCRLAEGLAEGGRLAAVSRRGRHDARGDLAFPVLLRTHSRAALRRLGEAVLPCRSTALRDAHAGPARDCRRAAGHDHGQRRRRAARPPGTDHQGRARQSADHRLPRRCAIGRGTFRGTGRASFGPSRGEPQGAAR